MAKKKLSAKEKWMKSNAPTKPDSPKAIQKAHDRDTAKPQGDVQPAPRPVSGVPRGTCAFPMKKGKACGKKSSPRGRWCEAHRTEVRKAQLAYNNATWRAQNKAGKTGHNLWFKDRPTMFAFKDAKSLEAAKLKAKDLHPEWTGKDIDKMIAEERKRLQSEGLRQNSSLNLTELKMLGNLGKLGTGSSREKEMVSKAEQAAKPAVKKTVKKPAKAAKKAAIKKVVKTAEKPANKPDSIPAAEKKADSKPPMTKASSGMMVPTLNLGEVPADVKKSATV